MINLTPPIESIYNFGDNNIIYSIYIIINNTIFVQRLNHSSKLLPIAAIFITRCFFRPTPRFPSVSICTYLIKKKLM